MRLPSKNQFRKDEPREGVMTVDDFASSAKKTKARNSLGPKAFDQLLADTRQILESGETSRLQARHLIGMYAIMHRHVYEVEAKEVRGQFRQAVRLAGRVVKQEFDGSFARALEYLRWCWSRERAFERKRGDDNDFRISWRYQFSDRLLTDYRRYTLKAKRNGKAK